MEIVIRVAALALSACFAALVIKRGSGEMSLALSLAACGAGVYIMTKTLSPGIDFLRRVQEFSGLSGALYSPVIKCLGIAVFSKLAADICRDSGQGAMAGTVELAAAAGALYVSLPLLSTLLDVLEKLI